MKKKLQIVTAVYNEEKNIEHTIVSFFDKLEKHNFEIEFIISEDGSKDNSVKVIKSLSKIYNIKLYSSKTRKNYSEAVLFGLSKTNFDIVAFVDSDGQYEPDDLYKMSCSLQQGTFVLGFRNPRVDSKFRIAISKSFKFIYKKMMKLNLSDPSSAYFIGYKSDLDKVLNGFKDGYLKEGFWWEFYARASKNNIKIIEVPVKHFERRYGNTVVFKLYKIPLIGLKNLIGLVKLKNDLKINSN